MGLFKNDYIIDLIEQSVNMFAELLHLREKGDFETCHEKIDVMLNKLGISRNLMRVMTPEQLVWLSGNPPDQNRCLLTADLITQEGLVYRDSGNKYDADYCYDTAEGILDIVLDGKSCEDPDGIRNKIEQINEYRNH